MRSVSNGFNQYAQGSMIPLRAAVRISFLKNFDDNIEFFTIGTSAIDSGDFIKGEGDVVQEWDKYDYADYSDRLLSYEVTKEMLPVSSLVLSIATITLSNHDDYFTTGKGSAIDGYILPYRPVRIYAGYGLLPTDEVIPIFIGLTRSSPIIDRTTSTATFQCIDFLSSLMERPLLAAATYVNARTDEVMLNLFDLAGISAIQLTLDIGRITLPYAYFEKDKKLGSALRDILKAEVGRLYMNEIGEIIFKNNYSYSSDVVYSFSATESLIDVTTKNEDSIINAVEIEGDVLEVQANQLYFELGSSEELDGGETVTIWVSFATPVTGADDPVYIDDAITSFFTVNSESDGSGTVDPDNVTLYSSDVFSTTMKLVFENSGTEKRYITALGVYATPVVSVERLFVRAENSDSIAQYDERTLSIDSSYFGSRNNAESTAATIIYDWSEYGTANELVVKGNFALQIDDTIGIEEFGYYDTYKIFKITDSVTENNSYTQRLTVRKFVPAEYFAAGLSAIASSHVISP